MKKQFLQVICWLSVMFPGSALSQQKGTELEVYGFIQLDAGYNPTTIDPDWFDVMRPTKLPSFSGEFGPSGNAYFSVRQTRLGIRSTTPTSLGDVKTRFEFDLFGFGADVGQTTFHLINAFAEIGKIGVGQTAAILMDQDVFPTTLDYWGPCSRTFMFNVQVRYTPIDDARERVVVGLERPQGSADGSAYRSFIELENIKPRFPVPNVVAHYRRKASWGHFQIGGILKLMSWNHPSDTSAYNLSGHEWGWGFNVNGVVRLHPRVVVKSQLVYGHGIGSYFADALTDVGPRQPVENPGKPFEGTALPVTGAFLFTEVDWTRSLRSSIGYSLEYVSNSDLQLPDAFRGGQYGLANLRFYPTDNIMAGIEYQYGRRDNYSDGYHSTGHKIQVSFKVNFSSLAKSL